jgi:hypothetical protein
MKREIVREILHNRDSHPCSLLLKDGRTMMVYAMTDFLLYADYLVVCDDYNEQNIGRKLVDLKYEDVERIDASASSSAA